MHVLKNIKLKDWFILPLSLALTGLVWAMAQLVRTISSGQEDWIRATICFAVLGLLFAAIRSWRFSGWFRRTAVVCLAYMLLWLSAIGTDGHIRNYLGTNRAAQTWNFFHYYLGSKYFYELGYNDLYPEMLKADRETIHHFRKVTHYRRQTDYKLLSTDTLLQQPRSPRWSEARWNQFKRDVATIAIMRGKYFWPAPFADRGYNAPPGWTVAGGTLAKLLSPEKALDVTVMLLIDPVLLLLAFLWSVKAYGLPRSMLVLAAAASWIGCTNLFGGKFLQYDWFAAAWAAATSMKLGRWATAGALLAYATSVRVFPGVLMLGPLLQSVYALASTRRIPRHLTRLLLPGAASLGLLCAVATCVNGRGLQAWKEFAISITEHNTQQKFSQARIGAPFLTTTSFPNIAKRFSRTERNHIYENNAAVRYGIQFILLALFVLAARRQSTHDAALLSVVVLFALMVSSRYYGIVYTLLLLRHLGDIHAKVPLGEPKTWLYYAMGFWALLLGAFIPPLLGCDVRLSYMILNLEIMAYLLASLLEAVRRPVTDFLSPQLAP